MSSGKQHQAVQSDAPAVEAFINDGPELAEARRCGVDVWALYHNLRRTPAERIRRHQIAYERYQKLSGAKRE